MNNTARLWIGLLVGPVLLNGFLWAGVLTPQQKKLRALQGAYTFVEGKPQLESSLQESDLILEEWEQALFPPGDPSAVTSAVERLARKNHLQIAKVQTKSSTEVEAGLTGRFNQLARWISDVEAVPGFQVESWTLKSGKEPEEPLQLDVKVTALLRGALERAAPKEVDHPAKKLSQKIQAYRDLSAQRAGYDVVFHRDLMRVLINDQGRVVVPGGLRSGLSVVGIIWSPERPFVVVDQELFSEGQTIGPYTVLKIEQDGVIAKKHDEQLWVPLARSTQE